MVYLDFPPSPQGVRVGRALLFGPSGCGKTTLAVAFIHLLQWPKGNIRCVAPPSKPTLSRGLGVDHLGVSVTDREAQERVFGKIFATVTSDYDKGGMDIGLAVDDADFYMSSVGRNYGSNALSQLVKLGREAGLSQVFCAQGSAAVTKDLVSNSNLVFMARTNEPNLLDYARSYMRDVPEVEHVISNLPDHVFLVYAPTATPKVQGLAWVNPSTGRIEWKDLEGLPPTEEEEEAPSPDDDASSEDATESSPIATGPPTVGSTTPPTAETTNASGPSASGTAPSS